MNGQMKVSNKVTKSRSQNQGLYISLNQSTERLKGEANHKSCCATEWLGLCHPMCISVAGPKPLTEAQDQLSA